MTDGVALKPTVGLVSGSLIQFAEGRWPEEIGEGLAVSEKGFNLVEPILRAVCPDWTEAHRYGVFELSFAARTLLAAQLRKATSDIDPADSQLSETNLLRGLADWLDERGKEVPVSIFGI